MPTYKLYYDQNRENHVDEEGRTLAEVLEGNPDEFVDEPPHYDQIDFNTGIPQRETVVTAVKESGEEYEYHEDDDEFVCDVCSWSSGNESQVKRHYTLEHGGD